MPDDQERTSRVIQRLPRGAGAELRISLDTIGDSRPFLSLRVWERPSWGAAPWLPTRKGVTLRCNELDEALKAIEQARSIVAGTADSTGRGV